MLILEPITFDNHQVFISNIHVTSDLVFMIILLGKESLSPKQRFKYKLRSKVWLKHGHQIGEDCAINILKRNLESYLTGSRRLGVKRVPIRELIEVDKYICPILRNHINLGKKVLYNLLDYGNEYIENISTKERDVRNLLIVIDTSIKENIRLRQEFDMSEDGKRLSDLKNQEKMILS